MITVTDVKITKVETDTRVKGVAYITIDDSFVVHDIKILETESGLYIAMPSRKTPSGEFRDIAHPINREAREIIQNAILSKYTNN